MGEKYFGIGVSSNIKDYLHIGSKLDMIRIPCVMSEFQYLDKKPIRIEVDESSGPVCQDFIYEHGIPLVSDHLKDFLDQNDVDYLFFKKIVLTKESVGMEEPYWLALPPRINCLNFEQSEIDETLNAADEIVINSSRVGRYQIFKLARVTNLEIIITEQLAVALKEKRFVGLHIYPIN